MIVGANWSSYPRIFVQQASRVKFGDIRLPLAVLSCVALLQRTKGRSVVLPRSTRSTGGRRDAIASRGAVDCRAARAKCVKIADTVVMWCGSATPSTMLERVQVVWAFSFVSNPMKVSKSGRERQGSARVAAKQVSPGCGQPHEAVICFVGSENAQHL